MIHSTKAGRVLALAVAAALAAPIVPALAGAGSVAHADGVRVRIGGSVHVGGHVRVHVGPPVRMYTRRYRPPRYRYRPHRVYIYGGFGYRFATPPPPPPVYCDPPPATYPCCDPAPVVTTAAVVQRDPLPRLGLGVTAGRFEAENGNTADDLGLFGRLRLASPLELEIETAKTTHDDGRLDKRLGAGLYLDLSPYSTWAPYVVGAAGVQKTEVDKYQSDRHYGEVGGGLRWRLSDRFTVAGDVRVGKSVENKTDQPGIALAVLPPVDQEEAYTRFNLKGILYF